MTSEEYRLARRTQKVLPRRKHAPNWALVLETPEARPAPGKLTKATGDQNLPHVFHWLRENQNRDEYKDRWVAFIDGDFIDSDPDPEKLRERMQGKPTWLLVYVGSHEEKTEK